MIVIHNFIILFKYLINNTIGFMGIRFTGIESIEFEYLNEDKNDEEMCYCNLCNFFRNTFFKNIILFTIRRLKCNKK